MYDGFLISNILQIITVEDNENLGTAIEKLVEYNIGALPVCDSKGALVGIISERDLLKAFYDKKEKVEERKIKDIMTKEKIKFEIVGCRRIGVRHAEHIFNNSRAKLVAVCDNKGKS